MNWDAIGAIGEIFGGTAIVVTIAYVAIELRHARSAAADVTRHYRAEGVRTMLLTIATIPGLAHLWIKSCQVESTYKTIGKDLDIDVDEAARVDFVALYWMWLHWGQYASIHTPEDQAELEHIISEVYSVPPISVSWQKSPFARSMLEEDFVRFVNHVLEKKKECDASQKEV
jgi:hypothetical protein